MTAKQVVLDGGSPWGFRISSGCDIGSPLKISRVNPGSKAGLKGIREGDVISAINGTPTKNIDSSTAHRLLRSAGDRLHLSLNEEGSSSRRKPKQSSSPSRLSEHKIVTVPKEVVTKKIVVRRLDEKDEVTTEKVEAEVHAEENDLISSTKGIWSPTQKNTSEKTEIKEENQERKKLEDEPIPAVWTPRSAQASPVLEKKEFRPVNFESPKLSRKKYVQEEKRESSVPPPWHHSGGDRLFDISKSPSFPVLSLPKAPNPTVTLLQKAREGHLPRGAHYLNAKMNDSSNVDKTTADERLEIVSSTKTDSVRSKKLETSPKILTEIGPASKEEISLVLRSEVGDKNKEKWYKRMYDSLHKAENDDDYVTVKYRTSPSRKGLYGSQGYQYGSGSGYQSEPESSNYDLLQKKYVYLDKEQTPEAKEVESTSKNKIDLRVSPPKKEYLSSKNQPGRIENYEPGHSSISELETNKWWDEVLEFFDRDEQSIRPPRNEQSSKSFKNYSSSFLSDPQFIYKRNEEEVQSPVSSEEQKEAYRIIQKGGEIPLKGLRKPAPERPKEIVDAEIEYFPLSSTLTRVRVHKQNITPLSEFPFHPNPYFCRETTLNFPDLPFGVFSSFSQVQIYPSFPSYSRYSNSELNASYLNSSSARKDQKFSVQLQNISGSSDYVPIVPKPRNLRGKSPIYVNLPLSGTGRSSILSDIKEEESQQTAKFPESVSSDPTKDNKKVSGESYFKKPESATFSDLKRTAPSIITLLHSKSAFRGKTEESKLGQKKSLISKVPSKLPRLTINENTRKTRCTITKCNKSDKILKKSNKENSLSKSENPSAQSAKKIIKTVKKSRLPLSESTGREKPLSRINKRIKQDSKRLSEDIAEITKRRKDKYSLVNPIDSKSQSSKRVKPQVSFRIERQASDLKAMSPAREESGDEKPKVDEDVTEKFRSRSFSPEVRRKIFKFPDMNKPIPSVKKQSKIVPTLKMWVKMKEACPGHRSRFDEFGSNIKFLQDKIKRKLKDVRDTESDIETVRTIKKNKSGEMSIKTDRYIRLARHPSGLISTSVRSTYPVLDGRKHLSETRKKYGSIDAIKSKSIESPRFLRKSVESSTTKINLKESEARGSGGEGSMESSTKSETLEKKLMKVTSEVSPKSSHKKTTEMGTSLKKTFLKSSSPCPSTSSHRSGASVKDGLFEEDNLSPSSEKMVVSRVIMSSPTSSASRFSSTWGSISPDSTITRGKVHRLSQENLKPASKLLSSTRIRSKTDFHHSTAEKSSNKTKDASGKTITIRKSCEKKLNKVVSEKKGGKVKKIDLGKGKQFTKQETSAMKTETLKKPKEIIIKVNSDEELKSEIEKGRDLVRTDSFFQNLFLKGPIDSKPTLETERISSVLERARIYQRRINLFDTYKSEPSLSFTTYYLNQKRPVSYSKFRRFDRDLSSSRSHSPLGSLHSENFQMKLRRFDSMSQFGDVSNRDFSPEGKERSSSEPPLLRSATNSPEGGKTLRICQSEISSMISSPISSRSPSCRRIKSYKMASKSMETAAGSKKHQSLIQTVSESEEKSKPYLHRDWTRSSSSLNLSSISDHTEYQAHLLDLMHSTRKCERFRELHKFYSNLEKVGRLEKTASTGDLRPRLRNEEIIDFDRWKKIRTKERAETELKILVDNLMKEQKEKDLLFRTSDLDAIRWKGDRNLRMKERSVEDLKEHFNKCAQKEKESDQFTIDPGIYKDHYKSSWKGVSNVIRNLNGGLTSHAGRSVAVDELRKYEETKIGRNYGRSLRTWSSLSTEQVNLLKDQLNEIYLKDANKKRTVCSSENLHEKYEIVVPRDGGTKSPGESSLQVRCSSAMSKSQTFTPTIRRKENIRKEWKKSDSISALPSMKSDDKDKMFLLQSSPKDEVSSSRFFRSHSEKRYSEENSQTNMKSKPPRPLSEDEKKRLSLSLSKEVIEKMGTKGSGKATVLPRETLGAVAAANIRNKNENCNLFASPISKEEDIKVKKGFFLTELESGSGSSETSIKTVIRKNSFDVLKKVQYFEELQQNADSVIDSGTKYQEEFYKAEKYDERYRDDITGKRREETVQMVEMKKEMSKRKSTPISASTENLNDYFGQHKQYATSTLPSKTTALELSTKAEEASETKNFYEENKWTRHSSTSPVAFQRISRHGSNDSLFSYRSRSVSPDPTKYYRAYLKLVKSGAVRKLCNKFESWEDLLSLTSDKDFWLPPAPRRFASDPELTRDMLRRFGTDPTKVTIKGQEVGDVRWLRTKFEKPSDFVRGRSRFRRIHSPLIKSPITAADRYMPRINVISKKAELQLQGMDSDPKSRSKGIGSPARIQELPASPEGYRSLIDYTKDHGGYYFTGEVEKLKRKFERLQEAERLSILGQMYTSAPDVNELRDIAPYLECSWVAHRFPSGSKSSELPAKKRESIKKVHPKPRPRSSSPIVTKQPSSILKQPYSPSHQGIFADQKFDPSIHRPKNRYQPEREIYRSCNRSDLDWWRQWNKPSVKFKELVGFVKKDPEIPDLSFDEDSPRKYVESEVTIHYKSPVRSEAKAMLSNDELARRQAESMKRIYKEERRRKYLQELQDMNSRRHMDNFMPSQKSPIPLNRYDDFPADTNVYCSSKNKEYSVDPVLVARGLYDFVGRRPRELAFRRGDIIFIVRRLDKNWCEGELNGVVGLFPLSYVEVIPYYEINMKFGRAIAKYDFVPQTPLELSARKGDTIALLRKIDENWFEGRIGEKTGIIPASYCHILAVPQTCRSTLSSEKVSKPVAAPAAHSLIHNGSGLSSKHYYTPYLSNPNSPGRSTISSASGNYHDGSLSADILIDEALMQLDEELDLKRSSNLKKSPLQPVNIRLNAGPEPALYQVLFNHVPNNDDELELIQGETVTVIEKCGDGWYIGSKTSDGKLGIFPGTHVRRIASDFV